MAGVPFVFGNATTSIPLTNLDANFNTGLTIGNTTVGLGNTVTTLGNVTLNNVTIVSGTIPAPTSIANGTSNVSISSSGGNVNVTTAGTTATFPQATGIVMVSGNMPAFSAYQNASTTVNNSTNTKIALQLEEFDTANAFDSTTNYRFTPQVAGYYQVNGCVNFATSATGFRFINIFKNGSSIKAGQNIAGGAINFTQITVSAIVFLNGSTDYIELYANQNSGGSLATSGSADVYFQACLVRTS